MSNDSRIEPGDQRSLETTRKGKNPFDRFITKGLKNPSSEEASPEGNNPFDVVAVTEAADPSTSEMEEMWQRMQNAQTIAERQREYTQQAIRDGRAERERPATEPQAMVPRPEGPLRWKWKYLWNLIWIALWLGVSASAIRADVVGGSLLAVPLAFLCAFLFGLPRLLAGGGGGVGRGNSSGAI